MSDLRAVAQQAAKFMRVFIGRKTYLADWPDHVLSQLEAALSAQHTEPVQPSEVQEPTKTAFRKWFESRTDAAIWRHEYAAEEGFDAGYDAAIRHKAAQLTDAPQPASPDLIRFDFINSDGNEDSKVITHDEMRSRYAFAIAAPQPAQEQATTQSGLELAARLVEKKLTDYDADNGRTDPETGSREYPGEGSHWVWEMAELADEIRGLSTAQPAQRDSSDAEDAARWQFVMENPKYQGFKFGYATFKQAVDTGIAAQGETK